MPGQGGLGADQRRSCWLQVCSSAMLGYCCCCYCCAGSLAMPCPPPTPTAPSQSGKPFKLFKPSNCCSAGGLDLSWRGLKSVELYDPRSDSWSWGPPLPAALPFAGKERNACKARLHSLMDPAPPPPPSVSFLKSLLPPPFSFPCVILTHLICPPNCVMLHSTAGGGMLSRGHLYVVGGGMYSSQAAHYDTASGCWHACAGPPTPRLHAAMAGASGAQHSSVVAAIASTCMPDCIYIVYSVHIHAPVCAGLRYGCYSALCNMCQSRPSLHRCPLPSLPPAVP